eukprot:Opistho-2@78102
MRRKTASSTSLEACCGWHPSSLSRSHCTTKRRTCGPLVSSISAWNRGHWSVLCGIILSEIASRKIPWTDNDFGGSMPVMLYRLSEGQRPGLGTALLPSGFAEFFDSCTNINPDKRPTFSSVLKMLHDIDTTTMVAPPVADATGQTHFVAAMSEPVTANANWH